MKLVDVSLSMLALCVGCSGSVSAPGTGEDGSQTQGAAPLVTSAAATAGGSAGKDSAGDPKPTGPGDQACVIALKDQVYAGTLDLATYAKLALSKCGIDVGGTTSTDGPVDPPADPTPADAAYAACANKVKAEVTNGTLPLAEYEAALAARCPKAIGSK